MSASRECDNRDLIMLGFGFLGKQRIANEDELVCCSRMRLASENTNCRVSRNGLPDLEHTRFLAIHGVAFHGEKRFERRKSVLGSKTIGWRLSLPVICILSVDNEIALSGGGHWLQMVYSCITVS